MSRFHLAIGLLILPITRLAHASPPPIPPTIETVCQHSMAQALQTHEDQFLVEVANEVGERTDLQWLLDSTRAQWEAELNRQCIESLIPMRKALFLADRDVDYGHFADCVLKTTQPTEMEACFVGLHHALIRTPEGAAARIALHVNQIRQAQLTHFVATGSYLPIPAFVPSDPPGPNPRPWPEGNPFQALGFTIEDGEAWGSYRVELVGEDDFKVIGIIDVDGDGQPSTWTATKRLEATRQPD